MVLLTGGTGYTGQRLAPVLAGGSQPVRCLVRPSSSAPARARLEALGCQLQQGDLACPDAVRAALRGVRVVVHLAPIHQAAGLVQAAGDTVERLVLVSSQRAVSRVPSASVQQVLAGEAAAAAAARSCLVVRPTMIYGPGDDRNVSRLAAALRRCSWLLVVGPGTARQQPVYVDDVVQAVLAAAGGAGQAGQTYALGGPAAFPFNAMVDMVAAGVGVRVRKLHVPLVVGLVGVRLARACGRRAVVDAEQLRRLQEDKACCIAAARRDLSFSPRSFASGLALALGSAGGAR